MRDRLIESLTECCEKNLNITHLLGFEQLIIADHLLADGWMRPPCKVGDVVYKICPKCNDRHKDNCKHCAWRGCFSNGCTVGVGVWSDGSYNEHPLQIVSYEVAKHNFITILEFWNIMFFSNVDEAEKAKNEYDAIRNIEERKERHEKYLLWEAKREKHYAFLKEGGEG